MKHIYDINLNIFIIFVSIIVILILIIIMLEFHGAVAHYNHDNDKIKMSVEININWYYSGLILLKSVERKKQKSFVEHRVAKISVKIIFFYGFLHDFFEHGSCVEAVSTWLRQYDSYLLCFDICNALIFIMYSSVYLSYILSVNNLLWNKQKCHYVN